jgi:hypothetical protein
MKRLNPKTNLPFKRGDIREDGYVFSKYKKTRVKKDGFFMEQWSNPISFETEYKKHLKYKSEYQKNNKTKSQKYRKTYYKNHKGKVNATVAKRRSTKLNATPSWLTEFHKKQIVEIYKSCIEITKQTGVQHHVDHIVPLKGKEVCGLHVPWNLQILTATENCSKNNKIKL